MRKLTQKNTAFLYEKEVKQKGNSLREMAAKAEHDDKIARARKGISSQGSQMQEGDGGGSTVSFEN